MEKSKEIYQQLEKDGFDDPEILDAMYNDSFLNSIGMDRQTAGDIVFLIKGKYEL